MTGMPPFNEFQRLLGFVLDGRQDIETVEAPLQQLERELNALSESFRVELAYLDWTPVEQLHVPDVLDSLQRIQRYLVLLRTSFQQSALPDLQRWTGQARVQIQRLLENFGILAEDVKSRAQLSPSSFVHEILRCGRLFLAERLSAQLFLDKVVGLQTHLKLVLTQLESTVPDPREASAFVASRDKLNESVEVILHTIEDLELELAKSTDEISRDFVEGCLESLLQETDLVFGVAQTLHESMNQEAKVSCFRCGSENVVGARSCHQCRALLPASTESTAPSSTIDLRLVDGGAQQAGNGDLPETYRKLVDMLEGVVEGRVKADTLKPAFDAVRNNLNVVDRLMDRLTTVPDFKTEDEEALYWEFRETLEEGIERTRESLDAAERSVASKDFSGLYACIADLRSMGMDVGVAIQKGTSWMQASQPA